jgi:thiamine-phosphate pyrophosphorylase
MALKSEKNTKLYSLKKSTISTAKNSKKDINKKSAFRIIDANLNRCREGLRVVEDSLRFVLDDKVLYKNIRTIRHNVDKILRARYVEFVKERDSLQDPGRQISETTTKEFPAVIMANFKRAEESLRVLEEYSKVFAPKACEEFKKQRYLAYRAEKNVYLKYRKFLDKDNE